MTTWPKELITNKITQNHTLSSYWQVIHKVRTLQNRTTLGVYSFPLVPRIVDFHWLYMSHFSYSCKTKRGKWIFLLIFRNGINWTGAFPLNIRNTINWTGAFSKAFGSSEALISVLSKMPTYMIIIQILFSQKYCTLY